MKTLGIMAEKNHRESRVCLTPEVVAGIVRDGLAKVLVQAGAGLRAGFADEEYVHSGAMILPNRETLVRDSDVLLGVDGLEVDADPSVKGKTIIGLFDPFFNQDRIRALRDEGATLLSLELIPRISRAQSMDVLSSQANIAGYVAVIMAAGRLLKMMPMMMTAAGTIKPAKVLIVGAGVAGLAAISTAKRLGAMVYAYDVRAAAREQVESLGAKFVEISIEEGGEGSGGYAKALSEETLAKQRSMLADFAKDMDVVITTAQIPGRRAPLLLDKDIFLKMKSASVVIDLAASSGGNVSGSLVDEWQSINGIWLYGAEHLARQAAKDASFTFAKNIRALLELMNLSGELDLNDEILAESIICHDKKWVSKTFEKNMAKGA